MAYIVKNCPAREDIFDYEVTPEGNIIETGIDTPNYCVYYKKTCDKITGCIIKQIYDYTDNIRENYNKHSMAALDVACNINDKFEIEEVKDNAG